MDWQPVGMLRISEVIDSGISVLVAEGSISSSLVVAVSVGSSLVSSLVLLLTRLVLLLSSSSLLPEQVADAEQRG